MSSITQDMRFRQSLILYAKKHGITNRQYIYHWLNRYDGTIYSLANKSHRPHHHSNHHTEKQLKLIYDMIKRNIHTGLVVFWVKLRQRGYTRFIIGLYRVLKRNNQIRVKPKNPKYIPNPYEQMAYRTSIH